MKLWARRGFEWAEEGLAGLWCPVLTGNTGSTLLDCNLSTNNNGTLTGYTDLNTGWVGSQFGAAVRLNGNGNRARLGAASVTGLSVFTVIYWGRRLASSRALGVIQGDSETNRVFFAKGEDDRWYCGGRFPSGDLYANSITTDVLDVNQWIHFVAVVRTGVPASSGFRVWVNSTSIPMNIVGFGNVPTMPNFTTGLDLSERYTGANSGFHFGDIAEVVLLPFEVSLHQIQQHHQAGPGGMWQLTPPTRRYATLLANAYTLIAASASYSITGQLVGLLAGRLLTADAASYLLAGNATGLNAGRMLTADSAAYSLAGQDTNLLAGRLLLGDTATYNLISNTANLLASRTLQANSAQYTVTGSDAALLAGRLLDCGSSAFLLSPNQAGLLAARKLAADQASILLTTQATNLYAGRKITADTAQFILITSPVDLTFGGGGGAAPYYYLFLLGGSR